MLPLCLCAPMEDPHLYDQSVRKLLFVYKLGDEDQAF